MKVLIACEESQAVCKAFRELGHEAFSCDTLPCSGGHPEWHIQDDVLKHLDDGWDLMIAHPPCTYLSNAGIAHFNEEKWGDKARKRKRLRLEAFDFVMKLADANIPKIVIENPVGWLNSHFRKPNQIIQPYYFGDAFHKTTCLWLKGLPILGKTNIVKPTDLWNVDTTTGHKRYFTDGKSRKSIDRSKTFPGIAKAMAEQWGKLNEVTTDGILPKPKGSGILPTII